MDTYTFKFRDNGIILNGDPSTPNDMFVDIMRVEGLSNAPYRTTERDREGADGGFIDVEFEQMRTIIMEGMIYGPVDTVQGYMENLKANFAPTRTPQPFYFQPPGLSERVVFCKSYGIKYDWETSLRTGITPCQIQLMAEDPTIYDSVPFVGSCILPAEASGRRYDKAFDYGYGVEGIVATFLDNYADAYLEGTSVASGTGGFVNVFNAGNKNTGAYITIFGPIDNPGVSHDVTGRELQFAISLTSDQFLTIDLRRRIVLLNGVSNRRRTLINTSRWFMLSPGYNSLRLFGTDPIFGLPDPGMTVVARGAYR